MSEERSPWARPESPDPTPRTPEQRQPVAWPTEPPPAQKPAKKPNRNPVALVIAGLVALGLVGAVALGVRAMLPSSANKDASSANGAGATAVRYLEAIARADAPAALQLATQQARGPLLTNDVLAHSQRLAPITDIQVASVNGNVVELAYKLGGKPQRGKFPMVQIDAGQWLLQRASVTVTIAPKPQMVPTKVNAVNLQGVSYVHSVEAFPGTYTMTTGSPWLDFTSPQFTVHGLDAPIIADASTSVSKDYPQALKNTINARLSTCAKTQELAASGCPWAFREDQSDPINKATIKYTLAGDPWKGAKIPEPGEVTALADGALTPFKVKFAGRSKSGTRYDTETSVETNYQVDLLSPTLEFVWQ